MRAVAYLRVSSRLQVENYSLPAQERLIRELCKYRDWEVVKIYREEGKTARYEAISRRPALRQLLEDAQKHQFDVVIVHSLDRWARNQRLNLETIALLGKNDVGLVSISENIDYSTPQGRLCMNMVSSFNEYFSDALAAHVRKGLEQRAYEGRHTGSIPFGYESCWYKGEKGEKICRCETEHPGSLHIHEKEGEAVKELFKSYSTGIATLSKLATWLNNQGFRTRNMHHLENSDGTVSAGPRLFTTASVRGILHNPFYMGKVKYRDKLLPGAHEPLISSELFELVQTLMKKNSGRSETLQSHSQRQYLLKGMIRCAYCGMPMWAQTYNSGKKYYREHKASRSHGVCPSAGGAILCKIIDEQIQQLIGAIELGPKWLEEVLVIISLKDEVEKVKKQRQVAQEKLRRMAKAYIDGLFPDEEYMRQKKLIEMELDSLVVPAANAAEEAGKLIMNLKALWADATIEEQRALLLSMLDAVYVDAKQTRSIVAIRPKPPFKPIFQVALTKEDSNIRIENEPYKGSSVFLVETGES